jgi:hypothetical protein
VSSRERPSRSSSSSRAGASAGGRGPKVRTDGKVDVACPQCGTRYRLPADMLDEKMECQECHRVFFPKTTAGKRVAAPDHTKTYLIFGGVALAIVVLFVVSSDGGEPQKKAPAPAPVVQQTTHSPSDHPRTYQIVRWAQAIASDNRLVLESHSDLPAMAKQLGLPEGSDRPAVFTALQSHDSTRYLRELECDSARLADEATMTAARGKATVFVTPKRGTDDYRTNTRGEIDVEFRMDGDQVKVGAWTVRMVPARNPNKPDPTKKTFTPNKDIAEAKVVEITDSAGTRKVTESQPGPVPHWDKASPELRAKADQVIADVLRSADDSAPGGLFNRATGSMRTLDEKKAVVPRALNAMYELYGDVNANAMKLSQLDRALRGWTGGAYNFELMGTGDPAKDKALRESCVRQWFAHWWRYSSGDFSEFLEEKEDLEFPTDDKTKRR